MKLNKWFLILAFTLVIAAIGFYPYIQKTCCSQIHQTHQSPNANYTIKVYSVSSPLSFHLPGSSGDRGGFIRLFDVNGNVLQEQDIDMIQNVSDITWEDNYVDIKLIAQWPLEKGKP